MVEKATRSLAWLCFAVFLLLCCYPFMWMLCSSFKHNDELFKPTQLLPHSWDLFAWRVLWQGHLLDWGQGLWNALFLSFGQTLLAGTLGFAFAFHLHFSHGVIKSTQIMLAVAAVLMPVQVMAIPLVNICQKLNLYDQPLSVLLAGSASGLGALYFNQAFKRIPRALIDAAVIDGASHRHLFMLFFHQSKGHTLGFLLLSFMLSWHAHLLPLLLLHSEEHLPLPLSMRSLLDSSLQFPRAVLMAASTLLITPPLVFFMLGYRALRRSLTDILSDPDG